MGLIVSQIRSFGSPTLWFGATFFSSIPAYAAGSSRVLTYVVLAVGTAFVAFYLFYYAQLRRRVFGREHVDEHARAQLEARPRDHLR